MANVIFFIQRKTIFSLPQEEEDLLLSEEDNLLVEDWDKDLGLQVQGFNATWDQDLGSESFGGLLLLLPAARQSAARQPARQQPGRPQAAAMNAQSCLQTGNLQPSVGCMSVGSVASLPRVASVAVRRKFFAVRIFP